MAACPISITPGKAGHRFDLMLDRDCRVLCALAEHTDGGDYFVRF
jgi:hypothetical protein